MSDAKVSAYDIRKALSAKFTAPEWYLGFEVGNSTGANCRRHADAVAVNAYPSKGFETRGFEIKVSKQDLKSELENGLKSDEIARFCDYWFLVVPKGLADEFTLPPTWGVIEYCNGALRQKTRAQKLQKTPPTSGFLCAMLRGRERAVEELAAKVSKEREEQIRRNALWGARNAEQELERLKEKLRKVRDATGISLDGWEPERQMIDRLNAAQSLDIITGNIALMKRNAERMIQDVAEIQAAIEQMNTKGEPND